VQRKAIERVVLWNSKSAAGLARDALIQSLQVLEFEIFLAENVCLNVYRPLDLKFEIFKCVYRNFYVAENNCEENGNLRFLLRRSGAPNLNLDDFSEKI